MVHHEELGEEGAQGSQGVQEGSQGVQQGSQVKCYLSAQTIDS